MARLSRSQEIARQQIVRLAGANLTPEQFGRMLLAILQGIMPADMQMVFGVDSDSLLFNRLLAVKPTATGAIGDWLRETYAVTAPDAESATPDMTHARLWLQRVYLANEFAPLVTFPELMRARVTAIAINDRLETAWGAPPDHFARVSATAFHRAYHETPNPPGGGVRACFRASGQWIGALQIGRLDATHPFRQADVDFLRLVAPIIGRGLRAAFAREHAARAAAPGPESTGVLVVNRHGNILWSTPAAEAWIALLRDTWQPEAPPRLQLPTAVWSALAQVRAGDADARAVRVPTPVGTVRIEAALGTEGDAMAVVLAPERPPTSPEMPIAWPLTQQERQVLSLVAHGLGNRQIAAELHVAEHTVEAHLAHAYEKLGVHSRSQFLARLFREVQWPALRASTETGQ